MTGSEPPSLHKALGRLGAGQVTSPLGATDPRDPARGGLWELVQHLRDCRTPSLEICSQTLLTLSGLPEQDGAVLLPRHFSVEDPNFDDRRGRQGSAHFCAVTEKPRQTRKKSTGR